MIIRNPARRRLALVGARSGFVVSVLALTLSVAGTTARDVEPASASAGVTERVVQAAATAGTAQVIVPLEVGVDGAGALLDSGDRSTEFSLAVPAGAACTGSSATSPFYRVWSYMVPVAIDPGALVFDSQGVTPAATGEPYTAFRQPLYGSLGNPMAGLETAIPDQAGAPGAVVNIPAFDYEAFAPTTPGAVVLPSGEYNIGVACYGPIGDGQVVDNFWNARVTITNNPADQGPGGITWVAEAAGAETSVTLAADPTTEAGVGDPVTLTATVTPDDVAGTVRFVDNGTAIGAAVEVVDGVAALDTTTLALGEHTLTAAFTPEDTAAFGPSTSAPLDYTVVAAGTATTTTTTAPGGSTTTTAPGGSTTTTTAPGGSTTTTTTVVPAGPGAPSGPSTGVATGVGALARTGGSLSILVWAVLSLIFGRMAMLLVRPPTVLAAGAG